ncbi:MAG: cytochrome C [Candidatus Entotheonella gemina]|uniref:Cytochrome C n=1 Tax=Candidatus Entotheonella gemina TaxID=1429439 RepID=W4M6G9_9BACT|nr:MAG: cytochrome C [Candidatus Entotheonella gemina]
MRNLFVKSGFIVGFMLVCAITMLARGVTPAEVFSAHVSATGAIYLPKDFRTTMVHLGSWFVPQGEASGFHDVYTEASTAEAYRKTGQFPDGATLVKELRGEKTGNYTTGANVAYAVDTVKQWFVMIKDTQNRFPENPLWGEGWGWALFKPGEPLKNVATNYRVDCLGCHIPAKANDWVYIEAYPTLKPRVGGHR